MRVEKYFQIKEHQQICNVAMLPDTLKLEREATAEANIRINAKMSFPSILLLKCVFI